MFLTTKKRSVFTAVTAVCIFLLAIPGASSGAVREVTLFPDSAQVAETMTFRPSDSNGHQAILLLPSQADPESLVVSLPPAARMKIDDVRLQPVARVDESRIAVLRGQIKKLQNDKKEMRARLQSLDIQLQFWQAQTKAKTKTIADADQLASTIGRNSRKIYSEKYAVETELEKIEKQLKELQDQLNQAAGKNEKGWEATVTLSGPLPNNVSLNYTYTLAGCGWQPLYRLEALPSSRTILFSWDAEIWQSTGADWKQVTINLATLQPVRAIAPPEMPQWIIKPKTPVIYKSSRREKSAPTALAELAEANEDAVRSEPVETTRATYSVWSLGKKTVAAGERQRLKIKEKSWPAQFLFLARPSQSPQAFLQAQIKLPAPVEIPQGLAVFVIDGAVIGKRKFTLAGTESDIYFGNSPFLSVVSTTTTDQSGVARIFQNKQTRQWRWLIEAKNLGNAPVRLRIEEPVPQVRDERIKLTFKYQPEPSEKTNTSFVWLLDLPGLQKRSIETGIELEAPKDMVIDFGWRR